MTRMTGTHADSSVAARDDVPWWTSARLCLAFISFLGFIHIYAQRVGMSVAIVSMVNQTAVRMATDPAAQALNVSGSVNTSVFNSSTDSDPRDCADTTRASGDSDSEDGPFVWDKTIQGHVLGSFFYGYLVSQIPAGMLAESFSSKWVFFGFTALSTLATLLTPLGAMAGWPVLVALRILAGIGSGACYPCITVIWSKWAPPSERAKLANISFAGSWMGNVISLPLAGVLCKYGFNGGWPSVFYVIGISSVLWLAVWAYFASDSPATHRRITAVEKEYILTSLPTRESAHPGRRKSSPPWLSILTSGPVWAIVITGICTDWGLYTFLTNTPTYMYEVLKYDVTANGFFSALPFLGLFLMSNIAPILADWLVSSGRMRLISVRKLLNTIGSIGAAIFILALAFIDCTTPLLAVALLFLGVTSTACLYSGFMVNPMDIAPRYAGSIMGLVNGLAACCGFAAPYTVAALTKNRLASEWRRVFFIAAGVYLLGALGFLLLGSGDVQSWAKDKDDDKEEKLEVGLQNHELQPLQDDKEELAPKV